SALTELIKGKTLDEASKVTNQDIVALLGSLPEEKMHCSVMGMEAMQAAIADYKKRHGLATDSVEEDDTHEGRIVCKCFNVTDAKIRKVALANNLHTVAQITDYTKAGGACGRCLDEIQTILDDLWREQSTAAPEAAPAPSAPDTTAYDALSPVRKIFLLNDIITREIRPLLERDGGGIELVDLDGDTAIVRLKGHCGHCVCASATLKNLVEKKLRELVSPKINVKEA
ncbi:MAG: NifU family protein, partial [Victivallales bacterium]|nr:NifU family protein [Victivallales bacterium]